MRHLFYSILTLVVFSCGLNEDEGEEAPRLVSDDFGSSLVLFFSITADGANLFALNNFDLNQTTISYRLADGSVFKIQDEFTLRSIIDQSNVLGFTLPASLINVDEFYIDYGNGETDILTIESISTLDNLNNGELTIENESESSIKFALHGGLETVWDFQQNPDLPSELNARNRISIHKLPIEISQTPEPVIIQLQR